MEHFIISSKYTLSKNYGFVKIVNYFKYLTLTLESRRKINSHGRTHQFTNKCLYKEINDSINIIKIIFS